VSAGRGGRCLKWRNRSRICENRIRNQSEGRGKHSTRVKVLRIKSGRILLHHFLKKKVETYLEGVKTKKESRVKLCARRSSQSRSPKIERYGVRRRKKRRRKGAIVSAAIGVGKRQRKRCISFKEGRNEDKEKRGARQGKRKKRKNRTATSV